MSCPSRSCRSLLQIVVQLHALHFPGFPATHRLLSPRSLLLLFSNHPATAVKTAQLCFCQADHVSSGCNNFSGIYSRSFRSRTRLLLHMPFSVPVQEAHRPRRSAALRDLRLRQLRHKGLRNIQVVRLHAFQFIHTKHERISTCSAHFMSELLITRVHFLYTSSVTLIFSCFTGLKKLNDWFQFGYGLQSIVVSVDQLI